MSSDYGKDKGDFHVCGGRCRYFGKNAPAVVDVKDINTLQKFMSPRGKLFDCTPLGHCAQHSRAIAPAFTRARLLVPLCLPGMRVAVVSSGASHVLV